MTINYLKIHRDVLRRLYQIDKSQDYLSRKLGIGRSTIWRLSKEKEISMSNFLKIINWLDKDISEYVKI
jgi:hypothetical protein